MLMLKLQQRVIWYVKKEKNNSIYYQYLFFVLFSFFFFQLSKLTVPMLKDYCRDKKLKASGTKKQDFIDAIQIHLGIA